MRRPGTDPDNVQMSDVLCDFCQREWELEIPMIEGHQGSIVCGRCLTVAYAEIVVSKSPEPPSPIKCTMCLEDRDDPTWRSPVSDEASICRRCIKQAAGGLHKDKDYDWSKPT